MEILAAGQAKLTRRDLFQLLRLRNELFRSRPHAKIFRQIHPPNHAVRIDEEFAGARDVMATGSRAFVQQVVRANRGRARIGEKGKCEARLLAQIARFFWRIHADCNRSHSQLLNFAQPILYSP